MVIVITLKLDFGVDPLNFLMSAFNDRKPNNAGPRWLDADLCLVGMLDKRMIALLQAVEQTGSITQAAKQVGLSYKGAWQLIERANNLAPKVLVATATGGSKGGGTALTRAGRRMLDLFNRLQDEHQRFLQDLNQRLAADPDLVLLLQRQAIKTSAGNQLFGKIVEIRPGAVNAEVVVRLKGGEPVVASLTSHEVAELRVQVGDDAILLINPPDIVVSDKLTGTRLSARNRLLGRVIRLKHDTVDSEVIIQLPAGETIVAVITAASLECLGLALGSAATAVFKSNAVMLGILRSAV